MSALSQAGSTGDAVPGLSSRSAIAVGVSAVLITAGLSLLPTGAGADTPVLARYPYLTDLTSTSVDVVWATSSADSTGGVVSYGPPGDCNQSIATAAGAPTSYTAFGEAAPYYQHSVLLKNLTPGTAYCYQIFTGTGSPGTALLTDPPQFPTQFSTPPSSGTFSFDVLGDFGETTLTNNAPLDSYNPYQDALDGLLAASAADPVNPALFAVSTGDIAYNSGTTTNYGDLNHPADGAGGGPEVSDVFDGRYWGKVGSSLPFFSVAGNHGRNNVFSATWPSGVNVAASGGSYTGSSPYPAVDGLPAGNYPSDWYAFTIGGVRFYILDSDWNDLSTPGLGAGCPQGACPSYQVDRDQHWQQTSAEYQWLANDLSQDRTSRGADALRMAFFHYPLRVDQANSGTQQDVYLQNSPANPAGGSTSLEALLNSNGVNLVFNGHAHLYQRSVAPPGGVPNYVTGGGGGVPTPVAASACSPTDGYARGWDPTRATGSSCGAPSDSGAAKPTAAGQIYHFLKVTVSGTDVTVRPTDSTGTGFDPMTYHFAADSTPPSVPGTPSAIRGGGTNVVVSLGSPATDNVGVVAYDIYRDGTYRATVPAGASGWTDVAVPAGSHNWTVAARDQRGNASAQSNPSGAVVPDTVPPSAPGAPTAQASAAVPSKVNLSWPAATDNVGVTSYRVYRNGALLQGGLTGTSALDSTAADVTRYDYTVQALDGAGNVSADSPVTSFVTPDWTPPTAPTLSAASGPAGTIRLSWSGATDNVGVSSYSIYRDGSRVATGVTGTSWVDSAMTAGSHRYYVLAVDAAGHTSPASNTVTANSTAAVTTAYIASSRQGSAVYINGLIKQQTGSTIVRSPGRTVYLQRFINGGWQNMLVRTSNATGQLAVGFVQTHAYSYRLYVIASTTASAATSGSTVR